MKALLSIKPGFVRLIFSGEKRFEYRKSLFKRHDISTVVVYATKPVCKIVGEFDVKEILSGPPDDIWNRTKDYSGVSKSFFSKYFSNHKQAYAIRIGATREYKIPVNPSEMFHNFIPPQSFKYIPQSFERETLLSFC